jgi:hypothetical protein
VGLRTIWLKAALGALVLGALLWQPAVGLVRLRATELTHPHSFLPPELDPREARLAPPGLTLRAPGLIGRFDARGVELTEGAPQRRETSTTPRWRFRLNAPAAAPRTEGNRVVFSRGADLDEWYRATPRGIEQGFTVRARPTGDLLLRGEVESPHPARRIPGGLAFGPLRYTELHVFDHTGRELRSALDWDPETNELAINVPTTELAEATFPLTVDPLISTTGLTLDPTNQAGAHFALVSGANDVNGDGYDDAVIGARFWDGQVADEGRAYLYLGGFPTGLSPVEATSFDPTDQTDSYFGDGVTGVGDVNGDGFADVLVPAFNWDGEAVNEGRAFLYLGNATGLTQPASWTLDPTDQAGAIFGISAAGAGDVNGDGFADVIIGASSWDGQQPDEGRAYLYLGSAAGLATTHAWSADPTDQNAARFGQSVASAGDVNGDGFGDVVVGAFFWDGNFSDEGRAFLYLGSATGLGTTHAWSAEPSDQTGARFGLAVAGLGDVNGDSLSDVAVGAPDWTSTVSEGRVYVFRGHATTGLEANATELFDPVDANLGQFGSSLAGADVNGDGYADLQVSAFGWQGAQPWEGRAYSFLGSAAGLSSTSSWTVDPGDQRDQQFSRSLAPVMSTATASPTCSPVASTPRRPAWRDARTSSSGAPPVRTSTPSPGEIRSISRAPTSATGSRWATSTATASRISSPLRATSTPRRPTRGAPICSWASPPTDWRSTRAGPRTPPTRPAPPSARTPAWATSTATASTTR